MWLLTLILAVLFGYALAKAKEGVDLSAWILVFLGVLAIGWVFGMIAVAIVPDLTAFMLPAETQVIGNIAVDAVGLILGLLAAKIEEFIIK